LVPYALTGYNEFFSGVDYETYQQSTNLIKQALELDPEYVYARAMNACLVTTGILLGFYKDLEEGAKLATAEIQFALKQAPNDPNVLWCWAVVQGFFGDKPSAIVALERAKDGNPNGPHILADLGNFFMQTGRVEEGLDLVRDAIDLSPREPRLFIWHYFMGHGYSRLDPPQLDKSLIEFDKALALFKAYIPSWTGKFMTLHMINKFEEAREAFDMMFELNPALGVEQLRRMVKMGIDPEEVSDFYVSIIDFYENEEDRKLPS
jgi:tetratricopeptide (TPR) repeat protein